MGADDLLTVLQVPLFCGLSVPAPEAEACTRPRAQLQMKPAVTVHFPACTLKLHLAAPHVYTGD
jgi:hypothetical protein